MPETIPIPIGVTIAGAVLAGAVVAAGFGQPVAAADEHAPMVDPPLIVESAPADQAAQAAQAILSGDSDGAAAWVEQLISTLPPTDPLGDPPADVPGVPSRVPTAPVCPAEPRTEDTAQRRNIQRACNIRSPGATTVASATQGAPISQDADPTDG